MVKSLYYVVVLSWLIITTPAVSSEAVVLNREHGYSLQIPAGWEKTPPEIISQQSSQLQMDSGHAKTRYVSGYRPSNELTKGSVHHAIIQVTEYGGTTWPSKPTPREVKQFAQRMASINDKPLNSTGQSKDAARKLSQMRVHGVWMVEGGTRVRMHLTIPGMDNEAMRLDTVSVFGQTAVIALLVYSDAGLQSLPSGQEKMIESFHLVGETAHGEQFSASAKSEKLMSVEPQGWLSDEMKKNLIFGGITGVIFGVVWTLRKVKVF